MYKTKFEIIKYGHVTFITFEYDYEIAASEAIEIKDMLMRLYDCDEIHIRFLLLNNKPL